MKEKTLGEHSVRIAAASPDKFTDEQRALVGDEGWRAHYS